MRKILTVILLLLAGTAKSQLSVTGTVPADGATNVPLTTTLAVAFSAPIDTVGAFRNERNLVTNVTTVTAMRYSAQQDTVFFDAILSPNTAYFAAFVSVRSKTGGQVLQIPYGVRFTTASSFPPYSVSGTVQQGATAFSPSNALVVIATTPFTEKPEFAMGTVADGSGVFTMPYVGNGTYYTAAAKDMTLDGTLDPSFGDAVGFGPTIDVNNANVTDLTIVFQEFPPLSWSAALDSVALYVGSLPSDRQLRLVQCWDADSLGRTRDNWQFSYTSPSHPGSPTGIRVHTMGTTIFTITDQGFVSWLEGGLSPIPPLSGAAIADSFVAKVERAGGKTYRDRTMPADLRFRRSLSLGRLAYSQFYGFTPPLSPDSIYWGAEYVWERVIGSDSTEPVEKNMYVGNFATGGFIRVTGVDDNPGSELPAAYSLGQNYPNPFNPSTQIRYAVAAQSRVTIEVFNLLGQKVATLVDKELAAGSYTVEWTAKVSSGIYLYRMEANPSTSGGQRFVQTRKLIVLQ